jgi:thiol-disulfide isomerase/thioredoxin
MELARNPNDQNIKNWITYNKKKNELNNRLQKRMKEYLALNKAKIPEYPKALALLKSKELKTKPIVDPARYRIRMYFSSTCPHCKRMFTTLDTLQKQGVYVEALQIDDKLFNPKYPLPTRRASKKEIKKHKISSVPFTLIADLKKKVLYPPIRGFQDSNQILNLIKEANNL